MLSRNRITKAQIIGLCLCWSQATDSVFISVKRMQCSFMPTFTNKEHIRSNQQVQSLWFAYKNPKRQFASAFKVHVLLFSSTQSYFEFACTATQGFSWTSVLCVNEQRMLWKAYLSHDFCLVVSSAYNLCKQYGPRSGSTKRWAWRGSKLFDTRMVFLKEFSENIEFERINRRQKSMNNYRSLHSIWNKIPFP